jgi:hypothetical protein
MYLGDVVLPAGAMKAQGPLKLIKT